MSNKEKYDQAFVEGLSLNDNKVSPDLTYNTIPEWDSIGHMSLISALEDTFKISMDTADIVELGSYQQGIDILKKYNVQVA